MPRFTDLVEQAAERCANGQFEEALYLYDEAVKIDPINNKLYSNRAAILCNLARYEAALQDAERSVELDSTWHKAYFRKGYALKGLGDHVKALVAYAAGLVHEPNSDQLLSALIECASISEPLKGRFCAVYDELIALQLEYSAFVVVCAVGQELLSVGLLSEAANVLESALQIDTTSLRLKQSLLSSLVTVHWQLDDKKRAALYMQQDLAVATSLGDTAAEARAHANLGMLRLSENEPEAALEHYRNQLVLVLALDDRRSAAEALSVMGQLYLRIGDYDNALAAYQRCLEILPTVADSCTDAMELAAQVEGMGDVYAAKREFDAALECYNRCWDMAKNNGSPADEARAAVFVGRTLLRLSTSTVAEGVKTLKDALKLARECGDKMLEGEIYGHLSSAYQSQQLWTAAKRFAERQLKVGLKMQDFSIEAEACGHLGLCYQHSSDYIGARRLHERHLTLAENSGDLPGVLLAKRNLGVCSLARGEIMDALKFHKAELDLSEKLRDRFSEATAHQNLASVHFKLGNNDQQLMHLTCRWQLLRDDPDLSARCSSALSLGQFHIRNASYVKASEYLAEGLMLAQEMADLQLELKCCSTLGSAYMKRTLPREAVRYFEQELSIAKDLRDHASMAIAYKHLGDAELELGKFDEALDCQKYFLALAHISSDVDAKLDAMEKIGVLLLRREDAQSALKVFNKAIKLAKSCNKPCAQARIRGHIGKCHLLGSNPDKAMSLFSEELAGYIALEDHRGQFDAFGHIIEYYQLLKRSDLALRTCANRIAAAKATDDTLLHADGYTRMAEVCMLFGLNEEALKSLDHALSLLNENACLAAEAAIPPTLLKLAECNHKLKRYQESLDCCSQLSSLSQLTPQLSAKTAQIMGWSLLRIGRFTDAVDKFQMLLNTANSKADFLIEAQLGLSAANVGAGQLSEGLHSLQQRLQMANEARNKDEELTSLAGIGLVSNLTGSFDKALHFLRECCEMAEKAGSVRHVVDSLANHCFLYGHVSDLMQLSLLVKKLEEVVENVTDDTSVHCHLTARLASAHYNLLAGQWLGAVADFDQAAGLAVTAHRSHTELDIQLNQAILALVLGRNEVAVTELEKLNRIFSAQIYNGDDIVDQLFRYGRVPDLGEAAALFEMVASFANFTKSLVAVEKLRWFAAYRMAIREQLVLQPVKDQLPNAEAVLDQLNLCTDDQALVCQIVVERQVFTWIWANNAGASYITTMSDLDTAFENVLPDFTLHSATLKFLFNHCVQDLLSANHVTVPELKAKLDQLDSDYSSLTIVGNCFLINSESSWRKRRRVCRICEMTLPEKHPPTPTIPSLVITSTTPCEETVQICQAIGGSLLESSSIDDADHLLQTTSSARLVHIDSIRVNSDGFTIARQMPPNPADDDSACGDGSLTTELDDIHVTHGNIVTYLHCADLLVLGCENLNNSPNMHSLANAFTLAGVKSILLLQNVPPGGSVTYFFASVRAGKSVQSSLASLSSDRQFIFYAITDMVSVNFKDYSFGGALKTLLKSPDECREALLVILHLVEKSLKRIESGEDSVLYTSQASVRSKVGPEVSGWLELLECIGFTTANDTPDGPSIYFPRKHRSTNDKLHMASSVLQALISLPQTTLVALSLICSDESGCSAVTNEILQLLTRLTVKLQTVNDVHFETMLHKALYTHKGVSNLFAALGFDKLGENGAGVFVKTIRVELTLKKCRLAITALNALFNEDGSLPRRCHSFYPVVQTTLASPQLSPLDVSVFALKTYGCVVDRSENATDSATACSGEKRKSRRSNGAKNISGYASEGEAVVMSRVANTAGGYFSDDDRCKFGSGDLLETTAKVLSVDERTSPLMSDDDEAPSVHAPLPPTYNRVAASARAPVQKVLPYAYITLPVESTASPAIYHPSIGPSSKARPPLPSYNDVRRRLEELNTSAVDTGDESDADLLRQAANRMLKVKTQNKRQLTAPNPLVKNVGQISSITLAVKGHAKL